MKTDPSLKRHALPVLALLLTFFPMLCSCAGMAQSGALSLAYKAYQKGNYVSALQKLSYAESGGLYGEMPDKRHAEVLLLKGRCVEGMGNRAEAANLYEYLIKTYPGTEFTAQAQGRLEDLRKTP